MDGYFHAAAVVRALGTESWLSALRDADAAVARLDDAFRLLREAPRAAARYPGHKALLEALEEAPGALAMRFGMPVVDMIVRWAGAADPVLRELVEKAIARRKLTARFSADLDRVRGALASSAPPVRNPDHDHGPTRNRSKGRRRGGG
jgi:hypothetical protein